jgi:flagellar basal-body rod protein FlgC
MPDFGPIRRLALLPIPGAGMVRPMFRSLAIASSGLSAQRQRMETIAQNIANADVTRGPDGTPYKRRSVVMESATSGNAAFDTGNPSSGMGTVTGSGSNSVFGSPPFQVPAMNDGPRAVEVPVLPLSGAIAGVATNTNGEYGVRVAGVAEDQGEGKLLYEPAHPDANADGYVRYPDIDTTQELVNLMDAKRVYEANAAVFQTAKSMLRAALDI